MLNLSLLLFLVALGAYLWYTFVTIYHLIRFGVGKEPKILALVFFIGSFCLFALSLFAYSRIDWEQLFQQILIFK